MPNSYAETANYTCPTTGKPFDFEVWLIVDTAERPDLLEKLRAETLHTVVSPYTHEALGKVNAPLLIVQPGKAPPLFFSPAQQTTQEQTEQHARGLVERLRQNMDGRWQDDWLRDGLPGVQRDMLPVVLSDDPQAEFERRQAAAQAALERLKTEDPQAYEQVMQQMAAQQQGNNPEAEINAIIDELNQPARDVRDMTRRVELCRRALALLPKAGNEQLWAALQNKLGNALQRNPLGSRAENIEQAIAAYQQALTVMTQQAMPVEWAQTLNNLAAAYSSRIRGEKADNIEQAIQHYQQALLVYTRADFPEQWAATENNLATAYSYRIAGNRADNLEQAIQHYQQALLVYTRADFPVDWAMTENNLATAYSSRIAGNRADNLEQAIQHYQQALLVYTRADFPEQWAATENNLATAYSSRIAGNRADNLEQAIQHYQQALLVYTRADFPEQWAATENNLATAYSSRIAGNRADNLEQAIQHYQQALLVYTRADFPEQWAATENNLATAYRNRIAGNRADNLEQAIQHYQQALLVYTRADFPVDWAMTENNLATAYSDRIAGNRADNLEQAIQHYQQALLVYTRADFPEQWAATENNLATAYSDRIAGNRADNLEQAIQHYQQALLVRTRADFPVDWAMTENNLANAYSDRIAGNRADNLEQAIQHYQQALLVRTRADFPVEHQETLTNLSLLYAAEGRWAEAQQTCRDALAVGQDIFVVASSDAGRQDAVARGGQISIRAAYSALRLGCYDEALAQLEAGRARLLAEALALTDANLERLTEDERERLRELRDAVRDYQYEARLPASHPARRDERQVADDLRVSWAALRAHLADLRGRYPDFMPEGLALDALLKLIPAGGALVAPFFTQYGSAVFVVPGGTQTLTEAHVIRLDDFTLDNLYALTRGTEEQPGWLGYYIAYRFGRSGSQALLAGIEDVTRRLWEQLVSPIHAHLKTLGIQQDANVLIMPQGDSNLLPLHAAWRIVDGQRRYFMDDYAISYTPSMSALASAERRTPSGQGALVAGVSKYPTLGDLPNARAEAEGIAELFKAQALLDDAATVQAVIDGAPGKAFVHLSCHGGYAWGGDAFASALFLAGEAALPLAAIIAQLDLHAAPLVTLSACETGIVDVRNVPDEFVGLPAAFMQAGARAVISSLWTVNDRSTALLMERMYQHMFDAQNPLPPMQALRAAQVWLRSATGAQIGDYYQSFLIPRMSQAEAGAAFVEIMKRAAPGEKPYAHPFFWAAFTYSGI